MYQNPITNLPKSFRTVRAEHLSEVIGGLGFFMEEAMKKIYVASPYSDHDPNHSPEKRAAIQRGRYMDICKIVAELIQIYPFDMFFSPIAHSHGIAKHGGIKGDHETWKEIDKRWILWSDEMWVADMPGRLVSPGIMDFEIPYAQDQDKKIKWL